ncbi:MAG: hypothetical protein ACPHUF_03765, partial [Gammaproteobacteria bacterium]
RPVTSSSIFCRNPEIKSSVEIFYGLGIAKVSFSASLDFVTYATRRWRECEKNTVRRKKGLMRGFLIGQEVDEL